MDRHIIDVSNFFGLFVLGFDIHFDEAEGVISFFRFIIYVLGPINVITNGVSSIFGMIC